MSSATTNQDHVGVSSPSIRSLPPLIEMFSPKPTPFGRPAAESEERQALWTADAVHRANNLAQMTAALGRLNSRFPAMDQLAGAEVRIKALANAYTKLGRRQSNRAPVACKALLREVVTGLIDLFGKPSRIALHFNGFEIFLPADARRALILIASELVINALKYAFPDGRPGTIDVSLWEDGGEGQLVVGDDGVGCLGPGDGGRGSGFIKDLGGLFGATVGRSNFEYGHLVWTRFPVSATVDASASNNPYNIEQIDDAGTKFAIQVKPGDIDPLGQVATPLYLAWVHEVVARRCARIAKREARSHLWVAVKQDIVYRRPAFLSDPLRTNTVLQRVRGSSASFDTVICRGDEVVAEARSTWTCLDPLTKRPIRMADDIAHWFLNEPATPTVRAA